MAAMLGGCNAAALTPDPTIDPRGRWTVVAVDGQATGGGSTFRFEIMPPTGVAQFGCNAGSGSLDVRNGWLVAGDWIITAAGCRSERLARFERMGFEVTARPMAVERRAEGIRLRNERGTIDLVPAPSASLAGRWRVVALNGRPVAGSAEFEAPRVRISFGCNDGRGAYRQDGDTIVLTAGMAVTERACMVVDDGGPSDAMQHEDEGFRIASRTMRILWFGPDRVRLSNEAGTIDLAR